MNCSSLAYTALAGVAMAVALLPVAHAASLSLEAVRVRLPDGQLLTLDDGDSWWRDPRVVAYNRYYYEPREREYVVYDERHPPYWAHADHREARRWCPPGHAKHGRC
ncbi:MAG: hypothetical protein GC129_04805 [Proteobacteria bacterium]|nr:hypothetical protein [Pseudomonadota bacterium]